MGERLLSLKRENMLLRNHFPWYSRKVNIGPLEARPRQTLRSGIGKLRLPNELEGRAKYI
jgi:hypothetical protein